MNQGHYNQTNIEDIAKNVLENVAKNNAPKVTLGELFKKQRLAQKIEISEISENLKIDKKDIEALESDDLKNFSPSLYIPGFIRTYARFISLDKKILEEEIKKLSFTTKLQNKYVDFDKGEPIAPNRELFYNISVITILIFIIFLSIFHGQESKDSLIDNESLILQLKKVVTQSED